MILGLFIVIGVLLIFGFESQYYVGILSGLASAFLAALFTVINGKLIAQVSPLTITKIEMFGGFTVLALILLFTGKINVAMFYEPTLMDWIYLSILGIICTTLAFLLSVWVMKYVTPFTVSMSLNMEPVYTIIIALIIDAAMGTQKEMMTEGFYVGSLIIIGSIFVNAYLKKRANQRQKRAKT
jgi:drug/metabolite transporter (DMT)-like permease